MAYSKEIVEQVLTKLKNGEKVSQIVLETGISVSTIYAWKKKFFNLQEKQENQTVEELIELAKEANRQRDWKKLEELQRKILKRNPEDEIARRGLIKSLQEQGKWAEVERMQRARLEANPKDEIARKSLIGALQKQEKWVEAEMELRAILEANPEDEKARRSLIGALQKQEKWEEAEKELIAILEANPEDEIARKSLRRALQKQEKELIDMTTREREEIENKLLAQESTQLDRVAQCRQTIKNGDIGIAQANAIIEELKQIGGVRANILIAEIQASVMCLPEVSTRFLQNCRKSATSEKEKKAYNKAIEIVKQSKAVAINKLDDITEPEGR